MGSGPSRERRNDYPIYSPPRYLAPPVQPTYPAANYPQYQPGIMPNMYPPGYYHQQFPYPNTGHWTPLPAPSPAVAAPSPIVAVPSQQTVKVHNTVNINKGTIQLIKDTENPGFYLLAFSYDAESPGSFNIFLFAKEDETDCSIKPLSTKIFSPISIPFEKGTAQTFKQASGSGLYLDGYDPADLGKELDDQFCPLVITAQTNASPSEGTTSSEEMNQNNLGVSEGTTVIDGNLGAPLPKSVNSQVTEAVILKKENGDCKVRVLRQTIWVDGARYELKELYGVADAGDKTENAEEDEDDFGKECVICLSETRDTAVFPCRHMCMCSGCAEELKSQMSKCPICRQQVGYLLKIDFRKK